MKKAPKRLISFLLAAMMALNLLTAPGQAVETNGNAEAVETTTAQAGQEEESLLSYPAAKALPTLTGNQARDTAAIALSQVGYKSSKGTVYGKWWTNVTNWGVDYTSLNWCAMFACWCANQAGAGLNVAYDKNSALVSNLSSFYQKKGQYTKVGSASVPKAGDFLFFEPLSGSSGHVGIVTGYNSTTKVISFVSGNSGLYPGQVKTGTVKWKKGEKYGSQQVLGFGRPKYADKSSIAAPGQQVVSDGEYHIVCAKDAAQTLSVAGASKTSGANVEVAAALEDSKQVFTVKWLGNGYYTLTSKRSGMNLEAEGGGTAAGTNVRQAKAGSANRQQWVIQDAGNGYFYVICKCSSLYLSASNGNAQTDKVKNAAQKWKFVAWGGSTGKTLKAGTYHMVSALDTTKSVNVEGMSKEAGANVLLGKSKGLSEQAVKVSYLGNGYYTLTNAGSQLCFSTVDTLAKSNVQQEALTDGDHQQWILKEAGDGSYYVISKASGLALDTAGGKSLSGTNVQVHLALGVKRERWNFLKVNQITASDLTRRANGKTLTFSLKAKVKGGTLKYTSSSRKITVKNGKITVQKNYSGKATITLSTAGSSAYAPLTTSVTVRVKPKISVVTTATSDKAGVLRVHWKKNVTGGGYMVQCSTDKNFKENVRTKAFSVNTKTSAVFKNLPKGTYYIRMGALPSSGKYTEGQNSGWTVYEKCVKVKAQGNH